MKEQFNLTYLFISHDMDITRKFCNKIMVLKDGKIVEFGLTENVFYHPLSDYTRELIEASGFME
jgi:ABC-type microcin C transport system duplicated ATPase subunit YejF